MIISRIVICFVAHLKSMAEAYILPDYMKSASFYVSKYLILMTVLLCLK